MSQMQNAKEKLKIAFLKTCLSDQVASRCRVDKATTMDAALDLFDKDFWDCHPTMNMRLIYIRMKQQTGQKFSDFAAELKKQGKRAN